LYIFRDFLKARGGERIFIEDAVATWFHVPIRSGLVGQTCAHECSKILVLKSKNRIQDLEILIYSAQFFFFKSTLQNKSNDVND